MASEIERPAQGARRRPFDPDQIPDEMLKQLKVSRERLKQIFAHMRERDAKTPAVGTMAHDFELELLSADGKRTGERRRLSSHRGRPVALVFGSYT